MFGARGIRNTFGVIAARDGAGLPVGVGFVLAAGGGQGGPILDERAGLGHGLVFPHPGQAFHFLTFGRIAQDGSQPLFQAGQQLVHVRGGHVDLGFGRGQKLVPFPAGQSERRLAAEGVEQRTGGPLGQTQSLGQRGHFLDGDDGGRGAFGQPGHQRGQRALRRALGKQIVHVLARASRRLVR